jgi:hypothetical protein
MRNIPFAGRASAAAGLALLLGTVALPVQAASVFISSVTGTWTAATSAPPGGVSGVGTSQISWGVPAGGGGQSSYTFAGSAPPPFPVLQNVAFQLGTFTHANNPIFAPSLTNATLTVAFAGTVNGNPFNTSSVFQFTHNETPNEGGGNCCNDIVTAITNPGATTSVLVEGVLYAFTFTGFQYGGNTLTSFSTVEGQNNLANLFGSFVETSSIPGVPIPGALPLFASGLVGLGMLAWRRKRKATTATD